MSARLSDDYYCWVDNGWKRKKNKFPSVITLSKTQNKIKIPAIQLREEQDIREIVHEVSCGKKRQKFVFHVTPDKNDCPPFFKTQLLKARFPHLPIHGRSHNKIKKFATFN